LWVKCKDVIQKLLNFFTKKLSNCFTFVFIIKISIYFSKIQHDTYMKKIFLLTLLFLTIFNMGLNAQRRGDSPKPPKKENQKPSKKGSQKGQSKDVQVFDEEDDYDYFENKSNSNPKNIIKINPFEALDGAFPIYYERVVSSKFSVEVGVGLTATSAFTNEINSGLFGNNDYDGFYKGKTGLMFKLGARYYAGRGDYAPEGTYFALEYQVKNFKFDAYPYINGSRTSSGPFQETTISNADLARLLFGYQTDSSSNFVWDYFLGVGWRKHTVDGWYVDENTSNPVLGEQSSYKPVLLLGVKMGIRF
jgi:hypothetical protein